MMKNDKIYQEALSCSYGSYFAGNRFCYYAERFNEGIGYQFNSDYVW